MEEKRGKRFRSAKTSPTTNAFIHLFLSVEPIAFFLSIRCYGYWFFSSLCLFLSISVSFVSLSLSLSLRIFSLTPLCLVSFFSPQRMVYLLEFENSTSIISLPLSWNLCCTSISSALTQVFKSYDIEHPYIYRSEWCFYCVPAMLCFARPIRWRVICLSRFWNPR